MQGEVNFVEGFNPHLTGYGLEATIKNMKVKVKISFNPHLTGYGLEEFGVFGGPSLRKCFNPHLTGYGLEEISVVRTRENQLFQSSSYWIRAGSGKRAAEKLATLTFQSSSYWIRAGSADYV